VATSSSGRQGGRRCERARGLWFADDDFIHLRLIRARYFCLSRIFAVKPIQLCAKILQFAVQNCDCSSHLCVRTQCRAVALRGALPREVQLQRVPRTPTSLSVTTARPRATRRRSP
jgi:hypothetical protein